MRKSDKPKTARKSSPAKKSNNRSDRGGGQKKNHNVQSEFNSNFSLNGGLLQGPILRYKK